VADTCSGLVTLLVTLPVPHLVTHLIECPLCKPLFEVRDARQGPDFPGVDDVVVVDAVDVGAVGDDDVIVVDAVHVGAVGEHQGGKVCVQQVISI